MKTEEQENFKKHFKHIVYINSQIEASKAKHRRLCIWDDNGSHHNAILAELERLNLLRSELKIALKEKSYEDWLGFSKKLSRINSIIKRIATQKEKYELQISELTF